MAAGAARGDNLVADYTAYWAGVPAAQIHLQLGGDGRTYRDVIEIRTLGLAGLITHFRARAEAEGRLAPGHAAEPQHYDARYDLRKWRDSRVGMRFVARDGGVTAERTADDTSRKALLDERYRRGIVDPLTALERVRAEIAGKKAVTEAAFVVPVYDGTRRFDVVGHILPEAQQTAGVLRVALDLQPIAGFKGMAKNDGDPDDAPRPVAVTLSDDARRLPIAVSLRVFYLPLVIRLDRVCSGAAACRG
jgi:hypothetical protein